MDSITRKCKCGRFVADIYHDDGDFYFTTEHSDTHAAAEKWANDWCKWANHVADGGVDSIYYIIQVPDSWAGPAVDAHPYQGLFVKIGRSKNVMQRLRNLQTGTYGDLVIHALEPGGSERETQLHKQFSGLRRQGEWFSCSQALAEHMFDTWGKYKMLPPEHQQKVLMLGERSRAYRKVREVLGKAPDTVNPALEEDWHGSFFVDLVYSSLAKSGK